MQEKSLYFLVEISLICDNVMSVMSEGLTSAASESTMRLISGSVTATRELSAIKGCDLSTRATYLRVYTVSHLLFEINHHQQAIVFSFSLMYVRRPYMRLYIRVCVRSSVCVCVC